MVSLNFIASFNIWLEKPNCMIESPARGESRALCDFFKEQPGRDYSRDTFRADHDEPDRAGAEAEGK